MPQPRMYEDSLGNRRVFGAADNPLAASTVRAEERIDFLYALYPLRPMPMGLFFEVGLGLRMGETGRRL